eukprot:scaffold280515_cov30-Tisochrysis_lutea.AAC.1
MLGTQGRHHFLLARLHFTPRDFFSVLRFAAPAPCLPPWPRATAETPSRATLTCTSQPAKPAKPSRT